MAVRQGHLPQESFPVTFVLRVSEEDGRLIKDVAKARGITVSDFLRGAARAFAEPPSRIEKGCCF